MSKKKKKRRQICIHFFSTRKNYLSSLLSLWSGGDIIPAAPRPDEIKKRARGEEENSEKWVMSFLPKLDTNTAYITMCVYTQQQHLFGCLCFSMQPLERNNRINNGHLRRGLARPLLSTSFISSFTWVFLLSPCLAAIKANFPLLLHPLSPALHPFL
jgi:hypothetical protein